MPWRARISIASKAPWRSTECHWLFGSRSRAKLQKPQFALQALVRANWQKPGPPSLRTERTVAQTPGRRGFALAASISSPDTAILLELEVRGPRDLLWPLEPVARGSKVSET